MQLTPGSTAMLALAGLKCPECDYELTGLLEYRCPECGKPFDPSRLIHRSPSLPFETAHGSRLIPAFIVTWFLALLMPWRFARQAVDGLSLRRAATFGMTCFTVTGVWFISEPKSLAPWWVTAGAYILAQAIWLTVLDFRHWRSLISSFMFWIAVGGYASAVVVTEFRTGPPLIFLSDALREAYRGYAPVAMTGNAPHSRVVASAQLILSLLAPICCLWFRLHRREAGIVGRATIALVALVGLYLTYAAAVEEVGGRVNALVHPNRFQLSFPSGSSSSATAPH